MEKNKTTVSKLWANSGYLNKWTVNYVQIKLLHWFFASTPYGVEKEKGMDDLVASCQHVMWQKNTASFQAALRLWRTCVISYLRMNITFVHVLTKHERILLNIWSQSCRAFSIVAMVSETENCSWSCQGACFPSRSREIGHLSRF